MGESRFTGLLSSVCKASTRSRSIDIIVASFILAFTLRLRIGSLLGSEPGSSSTCFFILILSYFSFPSLLLISSALHFDITFFLYSEQP